MSWILSEPPERIAVRRIWETLSAIINRDFAGDEKLADYVKRRLEGAADILRRGLILEIRPIAKDAWLAAVLSSKASKLGPRRALMKTLNGHVVEVIRGPSPEELVHYVEISPYTVKCTCEDSILTSSIAARSLGSAPRRILCKHVLAVLAKLVEEGAVDLESSLWREALREALLVARARLWGII